MKNVLAMLTAGGMALGAHHVATHTRTWHPRPHRPHVSHVTSLSSHSHGRRGW